MHIYGLTEVHGPSTLCAWQEAWDTLGVEDKAKVARQGVRNPTVDGQMVAEPRHARPGAGRRAHDGSDAARQHRDARLSQRPGGHRCRVPGGWFHTGDLAVQHPDGYIEIKDRSKDIIISGGENISSIEVEIALNRHPAVMMSAVVARPDEKWGRRPALSCSFVPTRRRRRRS